MLWEARRKGNISWFLLLGLAGGRCGGEGLRTPATLTTHVDSSQEDLQPVHVTLTGCTNYPRSQCGLQSHTVSKWEIVLKLILEVTDGPKAFPVSLSAGTQFHLGETAPGGVSHPGSVPCPRWGWLNQ